MAVNTRLEELRRRVQKDPASIAFAQLAEEYRRAGQHEEAVRVARAGLEHRPTFLSARVTLARALTELGRFEEARGEFQYALDVAPDNLAAIRGMADLHQRIGEAPAPSTEPFAPAPAPPAAPDLGTLDLGTARETPPAPEAGAHDLVMPPKASEPAVPLDVSGLGVTPAPGRAPAADEFALPDTKSAAPAAPADDFDPGVAGEAPAAAGPDAGADGPWEQAVEADPALESLERWLAAIEADRVTRDRSPR